MLSGSIRDDGPLPGVLTDVLDAQDAMREHTVRATGGVLLEDSGCEATLRHVRALWGYKVSLAGVDANAGATIYERSSD